MRHVLINADDLNYTPGINKAIDDLFAYGAISSTTAMMALKTPHFPDEPFISKWRNKIGLHLQLTQGAPLTYLSRIDGRTIQTFPDKENVDILNPTGVAKEWGAQLNRFQTIFQSLPCRIDSHHGVHRLPAFSDIAHTLSSKMGKPLRGDESTGLISNWTGQFLKAKALALMIKTVAENTPDDTVIEVVTHPGLDTHQLDGIDSWQECRENDYEELISLKDNWDSYLPGFTLL